MGQASPVLRRTSNGYAHWCPACNELHVILTDIPKPWLFDGDLNAPTFSPSVKITGKQKVVRDGQWIGDWVRGPDGKALDKCCHYILTKGKLQYCGDCTHALKGQVIDLPELPSFCQDYKEGPLDVYPG